MLELLDLEKFTKNLIPITSFIYFTKDGDYHPQGLFSESIFGPEGTAQRRKTFSYIDLNTQIIHPSIYKILKQLDRRIEKFISTEEKFSLDSSGQLQLDENGVTGYQEFIKMFPKINFRGGGTRGQRDKYINLLNQVYKNKTIFINKIPVISPEFRPVYKDDSGQLVEDVLNEKYLNIMKRVRNIKNVQSGPLYDLICYSIHQAVLDHNLFILTKINKKDGLIRQNLLGKRTDFSGRSVITTEPKMGLNEIGIPFRMAVALFEPFIIYHLSHLQGNEAKDLKDLVYSYKGAELSIDSVKNILLSIKNDDKIPENLKEIVWIATIRAMHGRYVVVKRDPALHDLSYRGMIPILVDSQTLLMCPIQVGGFGADFDGDTMAVFHPLSDDAQKEIKEKMMRPVSSRTSSDLTFGLSNEMLVGVYVLTRKNKEMKNSPIEVTDSDLENIKELYMMVKYRNKNMTAGRAIFNSCFPQDFPIIWDEVTKKEMKKIFIYLVDNYPENIIKSTSTKIQNIAFKWATISGSSFTLDDIIIPKEILDLKKKLKTATISEADKIIKEMENILFKNLKDTGLGNMALSGGAKGVSQIRQILVSKGLIADMQGNLMEPIAESYADGMTNSQQFKTSYGVRTGIVNRVVTTAETGYTSRKFAYLLNRVEVDSHKKDCGTTKTLSLKLSPSNFNSFEGRYVIEKGKLELFDASKYKVGDVIKLRSPIYCKSPKLCHVCYGKLIERMKTPYVGIYAAQKLGEAGTQTSMKKFHTGGAVSLKNKDVLENIINNDITSEFEI